MADAPSKPTGGQTLHDWICKVADQRGVSRPQGNIAELPGLKQPAKKFREFVEQLTKSASYTVKPASKTGQVMALFPDAARLAQELDGGR